jgi:hypothetical protein
VAKIFWLGHSHPYGIWLYWYPWILSGASGK